MANGKQVSWIGSFFIGSPLILIAAGIAVPMGQSVGLGMLVGAVVGILAGRALLRSI